MIKHNIWAEKYRPTNIDSYIDPTGQINGEFSKWKSDGFIPNLVLCGKPGTGKSSLISVICNEFELDSTDIYSINGSTHNSVNDIRDLDGFLKTKPFGPFKLVVIEESHRLTKDAQDALLVPMEKSSHVRFILTTNFPKKLTEPLLSRCHIITFDGDEEPSETLFIKMAEILSNEGIDFDIDKEEHLDILLNHINRHYPDVRSIINSLQRAVRDGQLNAPLSSVSGGSYDTWEALWGEDHADTSTLLSEAVKLSSTVDHSNFDAFVKVMYTVGLKNFPNREKAVIHMSDFVHKAKDSAFPSIHMEALLYLSLGEYE